MKPHLLCLQHGEHEGPGNVRRWAEASGVPFKDVLSELIGLAFERHRDKSLNETSR